jgi:hypothetical protein
LFSLLAYQILAATCAFVLGISLEIFMDYGIPDNRRFAGFSLCGSAFRHLPFRTLNHGKAECGVSTAPARKAFGSFIWLSKSMEPIPPGEVDGYYRAEDISALIRTVSFTKASY